MAFRHPGPLGIRAGPAGCPALWKFKARKRVYATPAVADDQVYVIGEGALLSQLYALEAKDGRVRWSLEAWGPVKSSPAVVVYFGSRDGHLYALH